MRMMRRTGGGRLEVGSGLRIILLALSPALFGLGNYLGTEESLIGDRI